ICTIAGNQQPGLTSDASYTSKQWNNPSILWGALPTLSRPSALASIPALSNINSWTSSHGIGQLNSNYNSTESTRAFRRGGVWGSATGAGVLALSLNDAPSHTTTSIGFR